MTIMVMAWDSSHEMTGQLTGRWSVVVDGIWPFAYRSQVTGGNSDEGVFVVR